MMVLTMKNFNYKNIKLVEKNSFTFVVIHCNVYDN